MSPRRSTRSEAQQAAQTLPTEYLFCRAVQHSWDDEIHAERDNVLKVWVLWFVCRRCDTRKPLGMAKDGYLSDKKAGGYQYPVDYKVTEANLRDKDGRAAVRAELLDRTIKAQGNVTHISQANGGQAS
jgi:hypothetical protein